MGVERDRGGGELRDPHVAPRLHAGPGALPLRHRTVRRRSCLARPGPPQDVHSRQRLRLPRLAPPLSLSPAYFSSFPTPLCFSRCTVVYCCSHM